MPVSIMCFKGLSLHYEDIVRLLQHAPETQVIIDHFGFYRQGIRRMDCFPRWLRFGSSEKWYLGIPSCFDFVIFVSTLYLPWRWNCWWTSLESVDLTGWFSSGAWLIQYLSFLSKSSCSTCFLLPQWQDRTEGTHFRLVHQSLPRLLLTETDSYYSSSRAGACQGLCAFQGVFAALAPRGSRLQDKDSRWPIWSRKVQIINCHERTLIEREICYEF